MLSYLIPTHFFFASKSKTLPTLWFHLSTISISLYAVPNRMHLKDQQGLPSQLCTALLIATAQPSRTGIPLTPTGWRVWRFAMSHQRQDMTRSACPHRLQLRRKFNGFSLFLLLAKTFPASTGMRHIIQGVGIHILWDGGFYISTSHPWGLVPLCSQCLDTSRTPVSLSLSSQGGALCRTQRRLC